MAVGYDRVYTETTSGATGTRSHDITTGGKMDTGMVRGDGMFGWGTTRYLDAGKTAANAANAYRGAAENTLDQAHGTLIGAYEKLKGTNSGLLSALDGIINGDSGIDGYLQMATTNYGKINQYAEEAKAAAGGIDKSVDDVRSSANNITNIAESLGEYAPLLKEMGMSMFDDGGKLIESANPYLEQGNALLSLDSSAGGLAGTYAKILGMLDPSLAVTTAANDTRSAFEQAALATRRASARRGVSEGSGQSEAVRQQSGQMLAAALAAMKTKTRQSSMESYLAAMRGAFDDAQKMGATGASIASQGVNAKAQGANQVSSAAGILVSQGQLYGQAGSLHAQTGNLQAQKANALTAAGQLTTASGNLALGAANAVNAATSNRISAASAAGSIAANEMGAAAKVADQQNTQASYYAGMFNQFAQMAGYRMFE